MVISVGSYAGALVGGYENYGGSLSISGCANKGVIESLNTPESEFIGYFYDD